MKFIHWYWAKAGKPFLLQISQYGGRGEAEAKPETVEAIRKRASGRNERQIGAAAVAEDVDINIGLLLKKLDEQGSLSPYCL